MAQNPENDGVPIDWTPAARRGGAGRGAAGRGAAGRGAAGAEVVPDDVDGVDSKVAAAAIAALQPPDGNFEIMVKVNDEKWWLMPRELSDDLLQRWRNGRRNVSYVLGKWGGTRVESYVTPDGEETPSNRYTIDFTTMEQRNSDHLGVQPIKIVQVAKAE